MAQNRPGPSVPWSSVDAVGAGHHEPSARRSRRLGAVAALNVLVAAGEALAGLLGHSMALLADSGHNVADVAAVALALVAVRLTRRPPTEAKSYGWHRSGVLAAQANAAGVLVVSVLIVVGAATRFAHPSTVDAKVVLVTALGAAVLNVGCALLAMERGPGKRDLNMRAAVLHMAGDAAASGGVVLAGAVLAVYPSLSAIDPAVSLVIAVLVAAQAVRLGRQVGEVLMEGTPPGTDLVALREAMLRVAGVGDVHDLHVWSLSSELALLSAHLVMEGHPDLEAAQKVASAVRAKLVNEFGIAHATLELECETCAEGEAGPCAVTEVHQGARPSGKPRSRPDLSLAAGGPPRRQS